MMLLISSSEVRADSILHKLGSKSSCNLLFCGGIADTVVLTHPMPGLSTTPDADVPLSPQDVLEKPLSKADNIRMLLDLNGGVCEVVTGVSLGTNPPSLSWGKAAYSVLFIVSVYPVLEAPGYKIKCV